VNNINLGYIFHCFRDMTIVPLKDAHFPYRPQFNHKFENVSLELHPQILYAESLDKGLITRLKSFS